MTFFLINLLSEVRNLEGRIQGMMSGLGFEIQNKTSLDVMTEVVLRSSEIEGEMLNADRVRSSIARHLGIEVEGLSEPGMTEKIFDVLERKDLRFILNALYLYIIMYINLRALWLLSVLRNYATI